MGYETLCACTEPCASQIPRHHEGRGPDAAWRLGPGLQTQAQQRPERPQSQLQGGEDREPVVAVVTEGGQHRQGLRHARACDGMSSSTQHTRNELDDENSSSHRTWRESFLVTAWWMSGTRSAGARIVWTET